MQDQLDEIIRSAASQINEAWRETKEILQSKYHRSTNATSPIKDRVRELTEDRERFTATTEELSMIVSIHERSESHFCYFLNETKRSEVTDVGTADEMALGRVKQKQKCSAGQRTDYTFA